MSAAERLPDLPGRIKAIRTARGLCQVELAAEVGVPRTTVSHWETGARTPTLGAACRLADALGVRLDVLVGRR